MNTKRSLELDSLGDNNNVICAQSHLNTKRSLELDSLGDNNNVICAQSHLNTKRSLRAELSWRQKNDAVCARPHLKTKQVAWTDSLCLKKNNTPQKTTTTMQRFLPTVNSSCEDDDQGCFQGGADGQAFRNGHRPDHYSAGREFRSGGMPGCSPCQRVGRAVSWACNYADRKEAKKMLQLNRYKHRRSAVVEVFAIFFGTFLFLFLFFNNFFVPVGILPTRCFLIRAAFPRGKPAATVSRALPKR